MSDATDSASRLLEWRHGAQAAVCDVIETWQHGTVVRATRIPHYWNFNLVRVEDDPELSAEELIAFADSALAAVGHRRIDFDLIEPAERLRPEFTSRGWRAKRLVWMRHEQPGKPPKVPRSVEVEEVPYDDVYALRLAWHGEDFIDGGSAEPYLSQAREVDRRREVRVLAARMDQQLVAFAQLEREGAAAEITQVYVAPKHRGGGLGTAMTARAIRAAAGVRDLWICADDEDRPKQLYARLGFEPVATTMEFQLAPAGG